MLNKKVLKTAINKTFINYPQVEADHIIELYDYALRAKVDDFSKETALKAQGYSIDAVDRYSEHFFCIETALLMHFTAAKSQHLILEAKKFAEHIIAHYKNDYVPWHEAAVKFNLTLLAEAKIFFDEDF